MIKKEGKEGRRGEAATAWATFNGRNGNRGGRVEAARGVGAVELWTSQGMVELRLWTWGLATGTTEPRRGPTKAKQGRARQGGGQQPAAKRKRKRKRPPFNV